eukprot:CAMPEP_0172543400 /NCGR_PEP_ID=MMETSP1067-20121228/13822_1 /TAXON_ID=265564 ORGANISM="Thalassiosira punctigera, Strain Tpunct2005C2" /NCGR_SAMPLE_ID=MMETSP1067 /ASSEMBLY_ACC=CAM_ASM_000444 /LENGTH=270 /DNA_ID=CAMNT_0013329819 /DNA_START=65 /DNA_END=877 /DNA_ORIENTATION=-
MRNVLVTGGNQGIGYALCKQLAIEHNCHVYLTARNAERGQEAASNIRKLGGSIDFIPLDTTSEKSIQNAAKLTREKLSENFLYGIVNNAGIGLNTGSGDVIKTNLYGPKLVCENFLPLLDAGKGRVVNVGSGSGPMYVGSVRSKADARMLCSPDNEDMTWDWIEEHAKVNGGGDSYGCSKALLACYTGVFARAHPNILTSCCTPGFINTQMTAGWGASKSPEEGTKALLKCLFENLEGNGWYYGSDGVRSPYHFMRNPGEPAYDGVNPFL